MADSLAGRRKRRIKNTPSGQRALAGSRTGTDFLVNPDGSKSSISTATFGVMIGGEERTMIAPTVVKVDGKMVRLTASEAVARARSTGDYAVAKTQRTGDRRSRKFSKRLGRISRKRK